MILSEKKLDRLEQLTAKLDVPVQRRRDIFWLARNINIRNKHADPEILSEVRTIIKQVVRESIQT